MPDDLPLYKIASGMPVGANLRVGDFSIIGQASDSDGPTRFGSIGNNVRIGAGTIVYASAVLKDEVTIDNQCLVGERTTIGRGSQVLYGAKIFNDCQIGRKCVIAGEIPNRVVIGDDVTFMGDIAHTYRDATPEWNSVEEPSPRVHSGSVVGMRALLIGPVTIGEGAYVSAGEIVRHDVPAYSVLYRGQISSLASWRGYIRSRRATPAPE